MKNDSDKNERTKKLSRPIFAIYKMLRSLNSSKLSIKNSIGNKKVIKKIKIKRVFKSCFE